MNNAATEHPNSLGAKVAYAWEAYHAADWPESYKRWEQVRELFPNYAPPYIHGGNSLREAGLLEEALKKLQAGAELFPSDAQLVSSIAFCLEQMGRYSDVDAWMENAIPRLPNNPEIAIDYIRLSQKREDHQAVLRGGELMAHVHPHRMATDQGVRHMISHARHQFELNKMDLAATRSPEPRMKSVLHQGSTIDEKSLML